MWQLTYMFGFLPAGFWSLLFFTGIAIVVASWVLKFIPFISTYRLPIQIVGIVSIMTSIWFLGAASNEEKWNARVIDLEKKLKYAQIEADKATDLLRIEQEQNSKIRQEKNKEVIKYIDKWRTKEILVNVEGPERVRFEKVIEFIEKCPIPKELLEAHNAAARNEGMKK